MPRLFLGMPRRRISAAHGVGVPKQGLGNEVVNGGVR
jgi:hypothetical protein